jgi:hypothetical protein
VKHRSPRELPNFRAPGRERLAELARFLDAVPPDRLTFSWWYGHGKGCAVALAAATDPWFQAQGLALAAGDRLRECHPTYEDATEWRALARFFELNLDELRRLFDRSGYDGNVRPHPHEVAAKIRAHLAETPEPVAADAPGRRESPAPIP